MSEQNQSGEGQESWDPYKAFNDAVGDESPAADAPASDNPWAPQSPAAEEATAAAEDVSAAEATDLQTAPTEGAEPTAAEAVTTDPYGQPASPGFGQSADPYGQTSAPQYGQSADPYGQPAAPQYGQPADPYGQPSAPQYGQSADPYAQPSAPQYGQQDPYAQQGQPYGQQAAPYGAPAPYGVGGQMNPMWNAGPSEQGASTLTLNYWLSVFFSWIPALVFYVNEKDKNALMAEHVKENLNFQLTRVIVAMVTGIPFIGWIVGGIGSVVLFVLAIMGALQAPDAYRRGEVYRFPLSLRLIK